MPAPAKDLPPTPVRLRIRAICLVSAPTLALYFRGGIITQPSRARIEAALRQLGLEELIRPPPKTPEKELPDPVSQTGSGS